MNPSDVIKVVGALGGGLAVMGIVWTGVSALRHRGVLGAQRAFFVGLGIMTAAVPISLLAIPDRPAVISAVAVCLFLLPLIPFAIAARLRVRNSK